MTEDSRKRALDEEIRFYESLGLSVGIVVPCPVCGLVMVNVGDEYQTVICPECGLIA
jgi:hypothetical protein